MTTPNPNTPAPPVDPKSLSIDPTPLPPPAPEEAPPAPSGADPNAAPNTPPPPPPAAITREEMGKWSEEFAANDGKLTDETYKALEGRGYTRDIVDTFIEGQKAIAAQTRASLLSEVGGDAKYAEMVTWARSGNMTPEEISAYNAAVNSGNQATAKLAISGLASRFAKSGAVQPTRTGGSAGPAGAQPFASVAELTRAMGDPKYAADPAYRKQVENRLKVSSF